MFRRLIALVVLAVCVACTDYSSQIAQLEQRAAALSADVERCNSVSIALSQIVTDIENGRTVDSFVPIAGSDGRTAGFILFFDGGEKITVSNTMWDACVVEESGEYFWKIGGKKYPVCVSDTPVLQFKVENGRVLMSADGGENWSSAGMLEEPLFNGITEDAASVTLELRGGGRIVLPKTEKVSMKLRCDYMNVAVGDSATVYVTLSGFPANPEVLAVVPEGWTSRVDRSVSPYAVIVKPSVDAVAGDVLVFATDGGGKGIASSVSLGVIHPAAPDTPDDPDVPDNPNTPDTPDSPDDPDDPDEDAELEILRDAYYVSGEGGKLEVTVSTNVQYSVTVSDRWLTLAGTKTVREDVLEFIAEPNPEPWPRKTEIEFESGVFHETVVVVQDAACQTVEDAEESACLALVNTSLHNVNMTGSGGYEYRITTTGSDPYVFTESLRTNLHSDLEMVTFEYKSDVSVGGFQFFFGDPISQERSVAVGTLASSGEWKKVSVSIWALREKYFWGNAGDRIRIDVGDAAGVNLQIRNIRFRPMTGSERRRYAKDRIELRSDRLRLMQDLTCGGAICFLAESGSTSNMVNICDLGRYVQQSYYAGQTMNLIHLGQSPDWSPWSWNPVQAGDCYGHRSRILDYDYDDSSSYVKCVPMRWDMNNVPADAVMEQWTSLSGNVVTVRNRITVSRSVGDGFGVTPSGQELPAVYPIADLSHLYAYVGNAPFTESAVPGELSVVNLSSGFWGRYQDVPEKWMAFIGSDGYGMAVYNPISTSMLAGRSGNAYGNCYSGNTSYIAPLATVKIPYRGEYEYTYYLIVGNLGEIRSAVYTLHEKGF